MHKAGRYTAAITLISVGAAVMLDKTTGSDWTSALIGHWPLLFILLGLEYLLFNMRYRNSERELKLDLGGVILSVILSAVVIVSMQSADFFKKFGDMGDFNIGDAIGAFTDGQKFDKGVTSIPLGSGVENVKLGNRSGNIVLKSGNVDQMQVALTVYVQSKDDAEAKRIADESVIDSKLSGTTLTVTAAGKEYGSFLGKRRPRMDLVITVPANQKLNFDTDLTNGKMTAADLPVLQRFRAQTTNGEIQVSGLEGALELGTTNGQVIASRTAGSIRLTTTNGAVQLTGHRGDAVLEATNGGIKAEDVNGAVQAHTTNGSVKVNGVAKDLKAETTNGSVEVVSRNVQGSWQVSTSHGSIDLKLPTHGDYTVSGEGSVGSIKSSLPFTTVDKKLVNGTVGSGKYPIHLETKGSINISSSD